jgi:hypothetical protein
MQMFKFKCPLLKPKPKIYFFEFFNTHISHLVQHSTINMALKWHHKNISNKSILFIEFWWSLDMFFGSFDCDCTENHVSFNHYILNFFTFTLLLHTHVYIYQKVVY